MELLFLKIRGETIKFSCIQKKCQLREDKDLITDIEQLESTGFVNSQLLLDKKAMLETIREERIQGQMIRSRIEWLHEGEKPSKYFSNLEKRNYLEKTVKRVQDKNGQFIKEQKDILEYIKTFYENLFSNKDDTLENVSLKEILKNATLHKVSDNKLGNPISTLELSEVLKKKT